MPTVWVKYVCSFHGSWIGLENAYAFTFYWKALMFFCIWKYIAFSGGIVLVITVVMMTTATTMMMTVTVIHWSLLMWSAVWEWNFNLVPLKCWIIISFLCGWSPEKTLFCSLGVKASNLSIVNSSNNNKNICSHLSLPWCMPKFGALFQN